MALPQLPHPHLIVLRSVATVVLSCLIGQAGWAAAFLGGENAYRVHHEVGAWVTLAATIIGAVVYVILRRSAGTVNVVLALVLAVAVVLQYALGEADATALHIFSGVLIVMLGTALTSWTYRHRMPTGGSPSPS
ncbi:hypothetical protein LKO27_09360 [Tessaracoccus sp. OS52]|uniref:hypothetical protein n=1 Tax=Tessaracoccus sp. OS52 TaxID=2886691 RepID=UPI001D0FA8BB|nr:hypothetical protein [Tessaracoccus sp. OS52]MCC2593613.1 hypothetical protein [Tessaracoccus sp. OS52]